MKKIKQVILDSLQELTVTKHVVLCGLFAALAVVLGMAATISIGPYVRIGFSGLPNRIVEFLFGPVTGCLFGGALDILKFILNPTGPYFFGFTLNAMLSGMIYGIFLYRRPLSIKGIIAAELSVKIFVNCMLNTLWLSMLYGEAFSVLFPVRVIKNAVMLPIDCFILFISLTYVRKLMPHFGFGRKKTTV